MGHCLDTSSETCGMTFSHAIFQPNPAVEEEFMSAIQPEGLKGIQALPDPHQPPPKSLAYPPTYPSDPRSRQCPAPLRPSRTIPFLAPTLLPSC